MIKLDKLLIVTLYNAIENDDPDIIKKGLSREDFEELIELYIDMQKADYNISEMRILKLEAKVQIAKACVYVLKDNLMDKDMMKVLNDLKFKITKDNYPFDLKKIDTDITNLEKKLKRLKDEAPDNDKKKTDKSKVVSIYDILASMSSNLEGLYLDPRKVTVMEFISYQNVLTRKKESYEKLKNK